MNDPALTTDVALLRLYAKERAPEAFAELIKRHAGLVYGTCKRVLGNDDDAQDVSQECFLELARKAGSVRSSLPAYLHHMARNRSIDAIRKASARRRKEEEAAMLTDNGSEPAWADIAPLVDEALARLPDRLRVPIILHYLEGRTQDQIAHELGLSQSTVSRNLDKGVSSLREALKKAGVIVSVAALAGLLRENAATAAPGALLASLGKIGVAGVGGAVAVPGVAGLWAALFGTVAGKCAVVILSVLVAGALVVGTRSHLSSSLGVTSASSVSLAQDPTLVRSLLDHVYAGSLTPISSNLDRFFLRGNPDRLTLATSGVLTRQFGSIRDLKLQSVEPIAILHAAAAIWIVTAARSTYAAKVTVDGHARIAGLWFWSPSSGEWVPSHIVGANSIRQPNWVL